MIRSLRWRLLLGALAVSGLIFTILGICIDHALHRTLRDEFDQVLLEKARSLATMVEQHGATIHFEYEPAQFPEFQAAVHPAYFQIIVDGGIFQQSSSLLGNKLPLTGELKSDETPVRALSLPDGVAGRMVSLPFHPYIEPEDEAATARLPPHPGILQVAQNTLRLDGTLDNIRSLLIVLFSAAAALCGGAMFLVVQRAVRPLRKLAHDIGTRPATDLSTPLSTGGLPSEIVPVVDRLNGLLQRLSEAFDRERAFTSDVAHELRTPLAGLLATLEVCRTRPRDVAAYQIAMDKCLVMLRQMQRIVENLLLLARAESSQLAVQCAPVDPGSLLYECWPTYEGLARERGVDCAIDLEQAAAIMGDAEFLRLMLCNLLENAAGYAAPGGRILIAAGRENGHLEMMIANTAEGLSAEDLPHLGQRFWRKDRSRSATGIHAGLGLSLCQRLAGLQNMSLTLRVEENMFIASLRAGLAPIPVPTLPPLPSSLPV